jgi:integrase
MSSSRTAMFARPRNFWGPPNGVGCDLMPRLIEAAANATTRDELDAAVETVRRVCARELRVKQSVRKGEVEGLTWGDLDLDRGGVRLDENKTNDPRAWALDPGVTRAPIAWREMRSAPGASDLVFVDDSGEPLQLSHLAKTFPEASPAVRKRAGDPKRRRRESQRSRRVAEERTRTSTPLLVLEPESSASASSATSAWER